MRRRVKMSIPFYLFFIFHCFYGDKERAEENVCINEKERL